MTQHNFSFFVLTPKHVALIMNFHCFLLHIKWIITFWSFDLTCIRTKIVEEKEKKIHFHLQFRRFNHLNWWFIARAGASSLPPFESGMNSLLMERIDEIIEMALIDFLFLYLICKVFSLCVGKICWIRSAMNVNRTSRYTWFSFG